MAGEVTAIKRQAHINQGKVNWIADYVIDGTPPVEQLREEVRRIYDELQRQSEKR